MGTVSAQSDAELLQAVREGNAAAYGQLYERHVVAARAMARQLVRSAEAEDVVAEAFTKILDLVGRGGGPDTAFRTYLLTVVRRTVHDRSRVESRQVSSGEIEQYDPGVPFIDPALAGLEKSLIARAYLSLPERWRAVLWHTEVERLKPADVAPLLGLSANGVAALAYRAREGLRQAYLQLHLGAPPQRECRPVLSKMGAYVRGGLARRESKAVDEHVKSCEECNGVLLELTDVNRGLRVMVGPLIAGPMFGGYAAALAKATATGGAGGLLGMLRRLRRTPRQQQAMMAGGTAVLVATAAGLLLVSDERPLQAAHPAATPVAQSPVTPDPVPVPVDAPSDAETPVPVRAPSPSEAPARVPPPVKTAKPGPARLRVTIEPLGALVRAETGLIALRLRNYGGSASASLSADVRLPSGVTLIPAPVARPGFAVPAAHPFTGSSGRPASGVPSAQGAAVTARGGGGAAVAEAVERAAGRRSDEAAGAKSDGSSGPKSTMDGWTCRPSSGGATCTRRPLAAGQGTAVFLRVLVAESAPEGGGPSVRVAAGSLRVRAKAKHGVRASGAPARFATDGPVTVRAIGNTLLTCPREVASCAEARRRAGAQRDNDLWPMMALDLDDRSETKSSSGAKLTLPKGGKVVWAGLYWSATGDEAGPIKLRPPGRRRYVTVKPADVAVRELPLGPVYQAFADVTHLVGKSGTYWAGDAPMEEGPARHAGWSLVMIVSDPDEPYGQAMVLDTATVIGGASRRVRFPLGGLTPAAAPARAELVTWEGDVDLRGDKVSLGTGALTPVGGDRDRSNVFDGSSRGVPELTFGVDVDTVTAELGADPGLTIVTDKDVVLFGVAAVSVRARQ
ncbi:sigma-70 family RNA polymerase sigma factor [Nonomuraea sp. NPDC052634]|jgi:RNA polymerase sigma factor (sigma-70 family)|uniref:sigma-70 family RNA polymerase sigma factor n=1 Tax=Nonomuraea sp. NPDC052634 TaxID=3155813 RepID=UPI00342EB710